jgi:TP901 family phage tail tape measure protein
MSQVQATMGITKDAMSTVNGQSVNTMDTLSALAKKMGSETAFSASDCAEALNYLALAGYNTEQICDTLPTVLNLAAAGNIDLATASDMVTDAMSALGMGVDESEKMVDQMAKTASSTNTSVAQLGEGILTIGATAKSIKGGTAELNTALGILANNGIKGAEGGTHLRNVILSLQSPTDTAAACMEQLGLDVYDSEGNMRSLNDILGDLNKSMEGMTSADKNNIISTIFNKTDLSSVNALLANTGDTWDDLQQSIIDSGGAAQQMADTQLDNLSGQITILKSALEGLAISFGELLMPVIKQVVDVIQKMVDKLNALDPSMKETIVKIALIAAAVGPMLIVIGKVISSVGSILSLVGKIPSMITAVQGGITALTGALGVSMGVILAIVAAIAALVAAFVHLWNTNEDFKNSILGIWEQIKTTFTGLTQGIVDRLNALGFNFESFTDVLKAAWDGLCNLLASVFQGVFQHIADIFSEISGVILGIMDVFIGLFTGNWSQLWDGVKGIFTSIWNFIVSTFTNILNTLKGIADVFLGWFGTSWDEVWTAIKDFFVGIWNSITTFVSDTFTAIGDFFTSIWNGIRDFFVGIWNSIYTYVSEKIAAVQFVITTVWDAISTAISTVLDTIYNVISTVWNTIYEFISPLLEAFKYLFETIFEAIHIIISNVMDWISEKISAIWNAIVAFITPILEGIKTLFETIWNAISTVISTVMDTISNIVTTVWNTISGFITDNMNAIWSVISSVWNTISGAVSSVMNTISGVISSVWNAIKSTVSNVMSAIQTTVSSIWDNIKSAISGKISGIVDTVKSGFNNAKSFVTGLASEAWNWGRDIISGIIDGIKNMIGSLADTITSVADTIRSFLHFSVPDEGPLTDYESWMPDFMKGLAKGINKSKKYVEQAVTGVAQAMKLTLNSDLDYSISGAMKDSNPTGTVINNYNNDNSRTVNQTNNSPKSLSRLEIYRQTRNALNT